MDHRTAIITPIVPGNNCYESIKLQNNKSTLNDNWIKTRNQFHLEHILD